MLKYDRDSIKYPVIYDNLLGLTNLKELLSIESELVSIRHLNLLIDKKNIPGETIKDKFCNCHKILFQDVYPWAGEIRDGEIGKNGTQFCLCKFIDNELVRCNNKIEKFVDRKDKKAVADQL